MSDNLNKFKKFEDTFIESFKVLINKFQLGDKFRELTQKHKEDLFEFVPLFFNELEKLPDREKRDEISIELDKIYEVFNKGYKRDISSRRRTEKKVNNNLEERIKKIKDLISYVPKKFLSIIDTIEKPLRKIISNRNNLIKEFDLFLKQYQNTNSEKIIRITNLENLIEQNREYSSMIIKTFEQINYEKEGFLIIRKELEALKKVLNEKFEN